MQLVFAVWFYNRDSPGQQELWIFAVMMLWEYYSMIYTRAKASIQLFPRASVSLFLIYHFYYFSFPAGFHGERTSLYLYFSSNSFSLTLYSIISPSLPLYLQPYLYLYLSTCLPLPLYPSNPTPLTLPL
ncbi:hypothetical protein B484DRAFT_97349 [Ochromonadaceae sp. CCMP2298]|nr:hypothetical protein B484DRAFT_97349 [Ochromonadaceae sp. CCMP2298]